MSTERDISLLLGTGGGFFAAAQSPTPATTTGFLSILPKYGIKDIDTAAVYPGGKSGRSEELLGTIKASSKFTIDTKVMVTGGHGPGAGMGDLSRESVLKSWKTSCGRLGVKRVRTLYCHRPDDGTPLVETAAVFNELYKQGAFEHWGVSNYPTATLQDLLKVCEENNFIRPTVYQGMYNVLCRHAEKSLFPILQEHNITYNVYSPTAGGLFASTPSSRYQEHNPGAANWIGMYKGSSKLDEGIDKVRKIAGENGIEAMELALRWAVHDSPLRMGDGVILGARNEEQLVQNLEWIDKGRLPEGVKEILDEIWGDVEDVAPGRV
ncbi:hypothetical protein EG327_005602 [Venturia inaequalis]|uniref:NADP-dependent oxidoreductase domain-containing protein n=1 Tax=Venturia inaequalis TaxID=5025 RepID=A0A8H3V9Z8_VENIN|nr:hypothetical protein EG327_005602 [Venturia inaequalis]